MPPSQPIPGNPILDQARFAGVRAIVHLSVPAADNVFVRCNGAIPAA